MKFDNIASTPQANVEAVKETARAQTLESDVAVPFCIALAVAVPLGIATQIEYGIGITFGVVVFVVVFGCQVLWTRGLLVTTERILRYDIDHDGHIGTPEPQRHVSRIEARISTDGGRGTQDIFEELPLHPDVVCELFQAALTDDRLRTERGGIIPSAEWVNQRRLLSKPKWTQFMAMLREHELAQYKYGAKENGHELTEKGRAFVESWLEQYVSST